MTPEEIVDGALAHGAVQDREELLQLVRLLIDRKIHTVCEIGTYAGGTLFCWSQIAKGMIVSLDYGDVPRDKFLEWHDPELLWTPKVDSHDLSIPPLCQKLCPEGFDFLFVDGGHSYESAKLDYELYSPLVKRGGVIAFHDIGLDSPSPDYQVRKFWLELKQGREYLEFDQHTNLGIGVISRDSL